MTSHLLFSKLLVNTLIAFEIISTPFEVESQADVIILESEKKYLQKNKLSSSISTEILNYLMNANTPSSLIKIAAESSDLRTNTLPFTVQ